MKLVDRVARSVLVQSDDFGPELGELPYHVFADARRTSGHHRATAVVAPQLVDFSQGLSPNSLEFGSLAALLLLFLCPLRGLHAAFVDLGHGFGNLAGGELTAATGGQSTERVILVELRCGRFR